IAADLAPVLASVVGAEHVPVLLHEKCIGTRTVQGDAVNTVADLRILIGNGLRPEAAINGLPRFPAIIGAKGSRRRNSDEHALRVAGIDQNGVQAHAAGAGLPLGSAAVATQPGELFPAVCAIGRLEDCSILNAGINRIRIVERRLQVPNSLELPGVLRTVIPLMSGERLAGLVRCVVDEFVALAFGPAALIGAQATAGGLPGFSSIAGALDDLPKPAAGLRGEDAIGIGGRSLH